MSFFTDYDRFGETSTVASDLERLDFRYHMIVEQNRALLEGQVVLDIASHDGRFSLAALIGGGARKVIGIEARESLVAACNETFAHYRVAPERFEFRCADIFTEIGALPRGSIDTVMVLGFMYHTARQYELIAAISALGARNVILDSRVLPNEDRPIVLLRWEETRLDSQIWDATRAQALSSEPSAGALEMWLQEFGYRTERLRPGIPVPQRATVYRNGRRVTITGTREDSAAGDDDW
jgi:hypothetical protein